MDTKQQVLRVVVYQRDGKHLKYQAKILPFLDALCPGLPQAANNSWSIWT